VSFTTIPNRLKGNLVRDQLERLLLQDYTRIARIFLTAPTVNLRGQTVGPIPDWLLEVESKHPVTVVRTEVDYGPIMKYIGPLIAGVLPDDCWVFICDDDMAYPLDHISKMVDFMEDDDVLPAVKKETVYTNKISNMFLHSVKIFYGYMGLLAHSSFLKAVHAKILDQSFPKQVLMVDDEIASIVARDKGFRLRNVGLKRISPPEEHKADALCIHTNRKEDQRVAHACLNPQYGRNLEKACIAAVTVAGVLLLLVIIFTVMLVMHVRYRSTSIPALPVRI